MLESPVRLAAGLSARVTVAFVAGWSALALAFAAAALHPIVAYDAWMYHLPFAARLWNLPGLDSFGLDPYGAERWIGYPKAWHWLQGLGLWLTGSLRGTVLPQLALIGGFLWYPHREHGIAPHWVALGLFASPMLLIHVQATYLDLPTGLCLAWGFLALHAATDGAATGTRGIPWHHAILGVALIGLAGNIKYQGTIGAFLVVAVLATLLVFDPRLPIHRRLARLGLLALAACLASATLFWNAYHVGQPLYPMEVAVLGHVLLPGPESPGMDAHPPSYLLMGSQQVHPPRPIGFLLSFTELDWTLRGVAPWYNIDAVTGRVPRRGDPSRTGGLGQCFVLFHLALLAWQAAHWKRLHDRQQARLVLACSLLLILLAAMPRSHELRYWLVAPVLLLVVNLRHLAGLGWPRAAQWSCMALCTLGIAASILSPRSDLLVRPPIAPEAIAKDMPQEMRQVLQSGAKFCDPQDLLLFRLAWAAPALAPSMSRNPADCR